MEIKTKNGTKNYTTVNERVKTFIKEKEGWAITTEAVFINNDACAFKCTVYDIEGRVRSTGYAQEDRSSSYINKTSYVENCVPLDTQILTRDGWKYYYQLGKDDMAWSYNMETGTNEYTEIEGINVYTDHPLVKLANSRFEFTCTPQHKWLVREQGKGRLFKVATEDLGVRQKIVTAVNIHTDPSTLGRRLGWLMCDSEINYTADGMPSTAYISQAKYADDVSELFGAGRKVMQYSENRMDCYEWVVGADEVRRILGNFGIVTYADLPKAMANAYLDDVAGCYQSMMLADGDSHGFSSTYLELVQAVQIMCARLGIATNKITSRYCKKSTKPIYTLGIKKTDGAWFSEIKVTPVPPRDVWCPTTKNGTWCARQNGFVTMTSNCETSAVGRALGFLGIGIDESISTYDEVSQAIQVQNQMEAKEKALKAKPRITRDQADNLEHWIIDTDTDANALLGYFKVKSTLELAPEQYEEAMKILKAKKR